MLSLGTDSHQSRSSAYICIPYFYHLKTESVKCIWYKVHLSDTCNDFRNESFIAMCKTFNLHCTSTLLQCVALDFMVRDAMAIVVTVLTLISVIILMDLA